MKIKEKMIKEYYYICDFCGKDSIYESDMILHEKECDPDVVKDEATQIWRDILKHDFRQAVERENVKAIKINKFVSNVKEYGPQTYTVNLLEKDIIKYNRVDTTDNNYIKYHYDINTDYLLKYNDTDIINSFCESYNLNGQFCDFEIVTFDKQKYYIHYHPEDDILICKRGLI